MAENSHFSAFRWYLWSMKTPTRKTFVEFSMPNRNPGGFLFRLRSAAALWPVLWP